MQEEPAGLVRYAPLIAVVLAIITLLHKLWMWPVRRCVNGLSWLLAKAILSAIRKDSAGFREGVLKAMDKELKERDLWIARAGELSARLEQVEEQVLALNETVVDLSERVVPELARLTQDLTAVVIGPEGLREALMRSFRKD